MKYFFAIILLISFSAAEGQSGFFIKSSYSPGVTNIVLKSNARNIANKKSLFSHSVSIALGYELNGLRISAGVGYLKTGYKVKDYTTIYVHLKPTLTDAEFVYDHFIIPLQLRYTIDLTKNLSILPGAGIVLSSNIGENIVFRNSERITRYSVDNVDFRAIYQPFNYMVNGSLGLEYKLGKNLDVYAGPSFYYMVPNFLKGVKGSTDKQHNYSFLADLGVILHIQKPAKQQPNQ